ncbi:hypothetical protein NDI56_04060 [Haloarcula sp. S1CR25-12]|uniref:Uncharacterized protein n=1 Tax=Haloarcula saliterrae TaxID=2950534 RepID=A0ABU2F8I4_9EURY|nr:hypothetical protein [Haloarcula sp. S1CR25-12]MDS0258585.1 hypothetical protein [Haloarcula sp. S1CR25-12]
MTEEDVDPRQRYQSVLATVDAQTSPKQRPGVRPETVYLCCVAHGQYSKSGVKASLQAALDNDDAIAYRDHDGDLRFCLVTEDAVDRLVAEYPETRQTDRIKSVLEGQS